MDEMSALEKFFRSQLLGIDANTDCVEQRIFNSLAPAGSTFPYQIFTLVPLNDNTGQARTSIQSRFLVDVKILSRFPLPENQSAAIAGVKEYFRSAPKSFESDGYEISVRHERPISYMETGETADDRILHRGGTYHVWMHSLS